MKKPMDFNTYKMLKKASYNEVNRWITNFYKSARQDGIDEAVETGQVTIIDSGSKDILLTPEDCTTAIDNDTLYELLLSVKGISPRIANIVIDKLIAFGVDETLWEEEQ